MNTTLTPDSLRSLADAFRERFSPGKVRALLVAGSGLKLEVPGWTKSDTVPLTEVVPLPVHELMGHDHSLSLWRRDGETILVMNGRFHLYQGYSPAEVVAPVRLAAMLGAEVMIATNATGSLDPEIPAGSLVVITDHINMLGSSPLTGDWGRQLGPQFPDMSEAYDPALREQAVAAASAAGFNVFQGIYVAMLGPSFETPAEVRMLRGLGATVVGMSTVPEVIAARHMGMKVLVLSLAANPAAGLVDRPLSHEEVLEAGAEAAGQLRSLLGNLVHDLF